MKKIAVIGGGASGLVAAIAAARTDHNIRKERYRRKENPRNRKRQMQSDKQRHESVLFPQ